MARNIIRSLIAGAALALGLGAPAGAETLDVRTGVDVLMRSQTTVDAFHYGAVSYELAPDFFVGEAIYSAAWGDAGGLFVGGVEAYKRFRFSDATSVDVGGFIGGGGGAIVVVGDGLMAKAQVTLNHQFASGFMAHIGAGWTRVTGSAIDTPHFTFAVSKPVDFDFDVGHGSARPATGLIIASAKGIGRVYMPISSSRRNNPGNMNMMGLAGAEFTFRDISNDRLEFFFAAVGAAYNDGAGYAEWTAGPRLYTRPIFGDRLRAFADVGVGFAGGGDVDSGGGLVATASAGLDLALFRGFHLEGGVMGIGSVSGDFRAAGAFLRGALRFDDPASYATGIDGTHARKWRFSTGLSYQQSHTGFRRPGHKFTGGNPVLVESGVDLFFGNHFYVNGAGYTVVDGLAGGFAMGTVGVGVELPLGQNWAVAAEAFAGAAAGGGIATGAGLMGGGKVELDYKVHENLSISAGVGKWVSHGTAAPWTLHGAIKIPLTSFHAN